MEPQVLQINYIGDVMHVKFFEGINVDLDVAQQMVRERKKNAREKETKLLAEYTHILQASKEARDYMASEEASEGIKACAILSKSLLATIAINFYLNNSAKEVDVPIKLFTKKKKALDWLQQF